MSCANLKCDKDHKKWDAKVLVTEVEISNFLEKNVILLKTTEVKPSFVNIPEII